MNVLVLLGSLRDGSTNRTLAEAAVAHLPEGATATFFNSGADLPHYSEDLDVEGRVPQVATELREAVTAADALIVVTPENNGTLSSVVKNSIDWASRPREAASIHGKQAIVLAASGAPYGAEWARKDAVRTLQIARRAGRRGHLRHRRLLRGLRRRPTRRRRTPTASSRPSSRASPRPSPPDPRPTPL